MLNLLASNPKSYASDISSDVVSSFATFRAMRRF